MRYENFVTSYMPTILRCLAIKTQSTRFPRTLSDGKVNVRKDLNNLRSARRVYACKKKESQNVALFLLLIDFFSVPSISI